MYIMCRASNVYREIFCPGLRGPPGLPGPSKVVNLGKGPKGLTGRNGEPGEAGPPGYCI